ncbi:glycosyltransferase [Sinomonas sp. JGH33]|uniref:Glycosyltransferase n=1 Tax=Sinomonas terricola TaxID=3110330 RepID=A0ABU5TB59_9MICC|nr:glycosyltransferase [Sinomonas sp. JGH33]MEA5456671.1 glycosyltransferase [Sinomonas sp. JGH33]
MSERTSDRAPAAEYAGALALAPAMESISPPEWPGARWVGAVDLRPLAHYTHLTLQNSVGYDRARLLVREGSSVRGFVEVDAPGGIVSCRALEEAAAVLPAVNSTRTAAVAPSITVVVCTRDRAAHLRSSLSAILQLDYPNFDVLVVDNAARTTETREMVRKEFQDSRVTLISEPVPGLSHARNAGLRHARGEIVAFTDDDVIVDGAWLKEIAAGFHRLPTAACVTGLVPAGELRSPTQGFFEGRVNWSSTVAPRVYSLANPPSDLPKFPFCPGAFGTGANFALRRDVAISMGGFDTALGVGTRTGGGEDIDMFTRVLLDGYTLVVQPSAIVWHRHRDGLKDLQVQARSYGTGLGAWLTKILLNPHTARIAAARIPRVLWNFVRDARGSRRSGGQESALPAPWARQLAKVLLLERLSIALGPVNYLLERWGQTGQDIMSSPNTPRSAELSFIPIGEVESAWHYRFRTRFLHR